MDGSAELKASGLATLSTWDTLALVADVIAPTIAKGIFIRRPIIVGWAERLGFETRAVRRLQALRAKYGSGPLLLSKPGRQHALVMAPEHVRRVLDETPVPFSPATWEKRSALGHFEPLVSLVSTGGERRERRAFNEAVLQLDKPVHSLAHPFLAVVDEEARRLVAGAGGRLRWHEFSLAWQRAVRRIVLGEGAADDRELTAMLAKLRSRANWAFAHPLRPALQRRFHARLDAHIRRGEERSLAGIMASLPPGRNAAPTDQVAHYLFAFDPAGMAIFRALALLATHPAAARRAREEIANSTGAAVAERPFLRATVLESLRLWPTTPLILRETTREIDIGGGRLPADTNVIIYVPLLHRDREKLDIADRFTPDIWLDGRANDWPLIPFSAGPGLCPARHLVPMLAAGMVAGLLSRRSMKLSDFQRLAQDSPMPGTLDNYSLDFDLAEPVFR